MDQEDDAFGEDKALYDEPEPSDLEAMNAQSGGANMKGAINTGKTSGGNFNMAPEDGVAPADREELMDDESAAAAGDKDPNMEPSFPARLNVMIEKRGKGTLQIETTVQDGEVVIDNVFYFANTELADAQTAEMDWKRRNLYEGPPFGNLDEDLQVLLERYLDERGVNTALALWVPEYIDFKEQREYLGWLSSKPASPFEKSKNRETDPCCRCKGFCGRVKALRLVSLYNCDPSVLSLYLKNTLFHSQQYNGIAYHETLFPFELVDLILSHCRVFLPENLTKVPCSLKTPSSPNP